ncbi:MAG: cytochrome c maturation protein CcmE [Hyphomicrobiales bacterium]|nr:cytochrome c maturation protein CcmE [Hyphomicrobiales bacterium]
MTRKQRRLTMIFAAMAVLGSASGIALYALRGNIELFLTPSEIARDHIMPGTRLRIGGLVEKGSLVRDPGNKIAFAVTDNKAAVHVTYVGLLPDLFREGQGIIAEGVLRTPDQFVADQVLAKHDERYVPKNVEEDLKKKGLWRDQAAMK